MRTPVKLLTVMGGKAAPDYVLYINGLGKYIDFGTHASIDDLHATDFTVEMWINLQTTTANYGTFIRKVNTSGDSTGWGMSRQATSAISRFQSFHATTSLAYQDVANNSFGAGWIHYAFTFGGASDKKCIFYFNGTKGGASSAAVGDAVTDAGCKLFMGGAGSYGSAYLSGAVFYLSWMRISSGLRYTANFTPPPRRTKPANDASTIRLVYCDEKDATTLTDYSANAQNATIVNGAWVLDFA